jgi:ribosome biogenesis GTPase
MPRARPPRRARGDQPLYDGRVVADFGHHVLVEDDDAQIHACSVRGRELRAVCGDRVRWQPGAHGARGVVEALLPRAHVLARPDARGRRCWPRTWIRSSSCARWRRRWMRT